MHLANLVRLIALLFGKAARLIRQRAEARRGLLLAHAAERVRGFLQAVSGATGFGFTLLRRGRAAHVVGGLFQAVEGLLDARIA